MLGILMPPTVVLSTYTASSTFHGICTSYFAVDLDIAVTGIDNNSIDTFCTA